MVSIQTVAVCDKTVHLFELHGVTDITVSEGDSDPTLNLLSYSQIVRKSAVFSVRDWGSVSPEGAEARPPLSSKLSSRFVSRTKQYRIRKYLFKSETYRCI